MEENILPFWMNRMPDIRDDAANFGFKGRIAGDGIEDLSAPKGAILNARILWTFSAAYRVLLKPEYLHWARYSYDYFVSHFIDREFGGVFWSLDCDGNPLDTKKQFYAIGFAIYGLSEYVRALQVAGLAYEEPLSEARALYECIETHSRDHEFGGYLEATLRDWSPIPDMRLSDKDMNAAKTMNTHLHILEPYTNLYRVWPDSRLAGSIRHLIEVFTDKIITADGRMGLFYTTDWQRVDHQVSYGHEIEAYWLLNEAAQVVGMEHFHESPAMKALEKNCLSFYSAPNSASKGLPYEIREDGTLDTDRHWWVQAEAVVGFLWIYRLTGNRQALEFSENQLDFICRHLLREDGEWYWSVKPSSSGDYVPDTEDDLAGFWKCPYHNSRMCLEILSI